MASVRAALMRNAGTPVFRKNPRIFPPAKSKLLRVSGPRVCDPVEAELVSKWWPEYKRQMAAIKDALSYTFEGNETNDQTSSDALERAFDEHLLAINEKWNKETKEKREFYYIKHFNEKIAESQKRREEYDQNEVQRIKLLKEKLLSMKAYNKSMVTRENLEQRLDEILSSPPVNYNHAISERGKPIYPEEHSDSST